MIAEVHPVEHTSLYVQIKRKLLADNLFKKE